MSTTSLVISKVTGLANPTRFLALAARMIPWMAVITVLLFAAGLYMSFASTSDYQQGYTVRIMYVHVPAAWLAMMCYSVMALSAIGTLVWRHPLADVANKAAAPLGAAFTALALYTGALWGRPTWGTFWEWDGRMTSTLVLLLIYLGIVALWRAFDDQIKAGRIVAIVTLIGGINIPIIKFSVDWWNTLHQSASVFTADGPRMPASLLTPLLVMLLAFTLLGILLGLIRMRTEILRRRADSMSRQAAMGAGQ